MAVIGAGLISRGHSGVFASHARTRVHVVCDVDARKLPPMVERVGGAQGSAPKTTMDYREAVHDPDVDAVVVCTPDHWHVLVAVEAMKAGKDVYCEKPLTHTFQEGEVLRAAQARYGAVFQTGSQQRSQPDFHRAAELVRNGYLGEIREIHCWLGSFPHPEYAVSETVPEEFDYDRWLGPAPWRPYHSEVVRGDFGGGWRKYWDFGCRKFGDWGAHHYDIAIWALGRGAEFPVEFVPAGGEGGYAYFRYADGLKVVKDNQTVTGSHQMCFIGTEGKLWAARRAPLKTEPSGLAWRPLASSDIRLPFSFRGHRDDWLDAIESRGPTVAPVEAGVHTSQVAILHAIATRLGRRLEVDPQTGRIIDPPEANSYLSKINRKGYELVL